MDILTLALAKKLGGSGGGVVPSVTVDYAPDVTVAANTMTHIGALTGAVNITLGDAPVGYDNEWAFSVTMGTTAYDVVLPTISWGFGAAPLFVASSVTVVRLYYVGTALCGEWTHVGGGVET